MPSVNLSPETYEKLKQLAARTGSTPEAAAEVAIHHEFRDRQLTEGQWRAEWDELVAGIRASMPEHLSAEQIDADIDATVARVRAERRARGH